METEKQDDGRRPLERIVSLRPCPFCGGESAMNFWLGDVQEIYCKKCLAAMKFRCERDWIDESAMQWNRRAADERMDYVAGGLRDNVSRLEDVVWDIEQLENWKTDMRLMGIHEVCSQALASLNALREQANA